MQLQSSCFYEGDILLFFPTFTPSLSLALFFSWDILYLHAISIYILLSYHSFRYEKYQMAHKNI